MPVRDRPCRWDCNNRRCDPVRCFGRIDYGENDPRTWLGRGWQDVPGRPFGWAWNMEREAIKRHLRRRIWKFGLDRMASARLESRVSEIQRRLHRGKPTMRERQALWKAAQREAPPEPFTAEELEMIAARFAGANDPAGQSIVTKAEAMLGAKE
jgi:hypothetical protein